MRRFNCWGPAMVEEEDRREMMFLGRPSGRLRDQRAQRRLRPDVQPIRIWMSRGTISLFDFP